MTKTQPVEHLHLTIGPAAVFSLAADLRQPPTPTGQFQSFSQASTCSPQTSRATRRQRRLSLVVANRRH
jgi:hypothetical protein